MRARIALVHMESAQDHYQAIHALSLPDDIKRSIILAQRVSLTISEDIAAWGKIKADEPTVFLPAFHNSDHRHIKRGGK